MQLVGLRYTEADMTVSYPGFLYLLLKMERMIRKGGRCGRQRERVTAVLFYLFIHHHSSQSVTLQMYLCSDLSIAIQYQYFWHLGFCWYFLFFCPIVHCFFYFISFVADKFQSYDMVGLGAITISYRQVCGNVDRCKNICRFSWSTSVSYEDQAFKKVSS